MKIPPRAGYIAVVIIVVVFLSANSGFRSMVRRYGEIHRLKTELENLKREQVLLQREIYFLDRDSSYIERIARRELGLLAPGEVEYRFSSDSRK